MPNCHNHEDACKQEDICKLLKELRNQLATNNMLLTGLIGSAASGGSAASTAAITNLINTGFAVGGQYWLNAITTVVNGPAAQSLYNVLLATLNSVLSLTLGATDNLPTYGHYKSFDYDQIVGTLSGLFTSPNIDGLISLVLNNVVALGGTVTIAPPPNSTSSGYITISPNGSGGINIYNFSTGLVTDATLLVTGASGF